jgi:hypothetical protein
LKRVMKGEGADGRSRKDHQPHKNMYIDVGERKIMKVMIVIAVRTHQDSYQQGNPRM